MRPGILAGSANPAYVGRMRRLTTAAVFAALVFAAPASATVQVQAVGFSGWGPDPVFLPYGGADVDWLNGSGFDHTVCINRPGTSGNTCTQAGPLILPNMGTVSYSLAGAPGIYAY